MTNVPTSRPDPATRWFLTAEERGNPATGIDRRRPDGGAWTDGNRVEALVDGADYFRRLLEVLGSLAPGDRLSFTDWRGDWDERLDGPGTEVGRVLASLARGGTEVRGLMWRSHPARMHFSEQQNLELGRMVNEAGGQVLLDERVKAGGCHHQKLVIAERQGDESVAFVGGIDLCHGRRDDHRHQKFVVFRHPGRPERDVAFVGGIDLCHSRRDDSTHAGDRQKQPMAKVYGDRPPWHDVQLEVRGPAVADLVETFRERWMDPTPLDHRNPLRWAFARLARQQRRPHPLPPPAPEPEPEGSHMVQVLRTYPAKRPPLPFAPRGERSIARAYRKVFSLARSLIYIEDQYLWSGVVGGFLADALRRSPDLHVVILVPAYPDRDGRVTGPPSRLGQIEAVDRLRRAGGDRVGVYHLVNDDGRPVYVHAKVCIVDDVWCIVGSDNMSIRSWTHDSELSCAVVDETRDGRVPEDLGGTGDGARVFARDLRLRLWREHLGRDGDDGLVDSVEGARAWREAAHRSGSRVRRHVTEPVHGWQVLWAKPMYRLVVDPDGRPVGHRGTF